jgi:UMF1 family MFS transporter
METQHVGEQEPKDPMLRYVPRVFKFDRAPIEATGLSLDIYARATILMSSLFLGPALLSLAAEEAQLDCEAAGVDDIHECVVDARVYGFRPSSLLSNIAIAAGLLGALILPPCGAIMDYTPYRRHVGVISGLCLILVKGVEIMISLDTWFFITCLQVLSSVLFSIHLSSIYAYTSELGMDPNDQAKYNTYYFIVMFCSTLVFMVEVLAFAFLFDTSDVGTAKIALTIAAATCILFFGFAWTYLFRDRPPLSLVEEGQSVFLSGFRKLIRTSVRIKRELPALRWFMGSIIFAESANNSLVTIATTYMSHFLEMDAKEIGIVFFIALIMGAPGAKLGEYVAIHTNPLLSAKCCDFLYIVITGVGAKVLTPERKQYTFIFGAFWGICLGTLYVVVICNVWAIWAKQMLTYSSLRFLWSSSGWLHPMHTTIFVTIRPSGQDAEMMGLYLFCASAFSWLPPLAFTIINERGIHMSWGLASLNLFFILGLVCLFGMGSYEHAMHLVRSETELRDDDKNPVIDDKVLDTANPSRTYAYKEIEQAKREEKDGGELELRPIS